MSKRWQLAAFPNYYAYTLRLNGRELNWNEKEHFVHCVNQIYRESEHVIFRGDKKEHLQRIYRLPGTWSPNAFNREFFFYGAKSTLFLLPTEVRQQALNISAGNNDAFSRLFRMIRELLLSNYSREQRDTLDRLTRNNGPLVSFFLQADNEKQFREGIDKLSEEQRLRLRDHYLSLLHHIGAGTYYSSTFMLSTTESFTKACNFAFGSKSVVPAAQARETAIIIMGWVPRGLRNVIKALRSTDFRPGSPLYAIGLPLYKAILHPFEREITLKGGLFPHYILGYLHWENEKEIFEVNPALFDVDDHWDGRELPVDQSSWEERIQTTEFGAYFQLHNDQMFSQQEIGPVRG